MRGCVVAAWTWQRCGFEYAMRCDVNEYRLERVEGVMNKGTGGEARGKGREASFKYF